MSDPGLWLAIAGLALGLIGQWVRVNTRITSIETKSAADKVTCDAALVQMRAETMAVEARGTSRTERLGQQLDRIDAKVDRLLERHP